LVVVVKSRVLCRYILPLCALLSSCGKAVEQPLEQVSAKSCAVNRDADFSIRNVDGSIRIYGSDKPEMRMQATKAAYTAERLNKIVVDVSARPDAVSIETHFPPTATWGLSDRSGTVDYVIVIPATARVSRLELANGEVLVDSMEGKNVYAHLVNGRLFSHNCFGNLRLSVTNGGLELIYDWWERRRFSIDAQIANGNIRAFLPGNASLHLAAQAMNGKIGNDFAHKEQRTGSPVNNIDTTVGEQPAANMKLRAEHGNIRIVEKNP
jgi:hypothetical protein